MSEATPRPASCDALGDLGDHADLGVVAAAPRDEQHARIAADVHRQRHRHAGEHHGIVEGDQFEGCHEIEVTPNS